MSSICGVSFPSNAGAYSAPSPFAPLTRCLFHPEGPSKSVMRVLAAPKPKVSSTTSSLPGEVAPSSPISVAASGTPASSPGTPATVAPVTPSSKGDMPPPSAVPRRVSKKQKPTCPPGLAAAAIAAERPAEPQGKGWPQDVKLLFAATGFRWRKESGPGAHMRSLGHIDKTECIPALCEVAQELYDAMKSEPIGTLVEAFRGGVERLARWTGYHLGLVKPKYDIYRRPLEGIRAVLEFNGALNSLGSVMERLVRRRLVTFTTLYQGKVKKLPPIGVGFGVSSRQCACITEALRAGFRMEELDPKPRFTAYGDTVVLWTLLVATPAGDEAFHYGPIPEEHISAFREASDLVHNPLADVDFATYNHEWAYVLREDLLLDLAGSNQQTRYPAKSMLVRAAYAPDASKSDRKLSHRWRPFLSNTQSHIAADLELLPYAKRKTTHFPNHLHTHTHLRIRFPDPPRQAP